MASRVISQQEVMVELACLPLVICSETIQPISISLNKKATVESTKANRTFVEQYGLRNSKYHHLSLKEYFDQVYNAKKKSTGTTIPHFVGGSTYSTYPITESYARSMLYIYKPWNKMNPLPNKNYREQFETFLQDDTCPLSLKIIHQREKERQRHKQPTAQEGEGDYQNAPGLDDTPINDILHMAGLFNRTINECESLHGLKIDKGLHYSWDKRVILTETLPDNSSTWLLDQITNDRERQTGTSHKDIIRLTKDVNGKPYNLDMANSDQKDIILNIFRKIREWIEWNTSDQQAFEPLRLTGMYLSILYTNDLSHLVTHFDV